MMVSGMEVTDSISNIKISEAQRGAEQTPSEPLLPSGIYDVDESVKACGIGSSGVTWTLLTSVSFPCPWNRDHACANIWHVTVGQDRESHCRNALWRREELLPQGGLTSQWRDLQQLTPNVRS